MSIIKTRKEALKEAIAMLSEIGGYDETISLLEDIHDELPLIHWSDKSIRDTVNQFVKDNGRMPTTNDFRKKGMPPHPVIQNLYKISLAEWLDENYPRYKPTRDELKQKYTDEFISDYFRIKPKSQREFNASRTPGTKGWQTLAEYYGVSSWRKLIKTMGLPFYFEMKKDREPPKFVVDVYTDLYDCT